METFLEFKLSNGETLTATALNIVVENETCDYGTYDCVLHYKNKSSQFKCYFATCSSVNLHSAMFGFILPVIERKMHGVIGEQQSVADKERVNAFEQLFGTSKQSDKFARELLSKIDALVYKK